MLLVKIFAVSLAWTFVESINEADNLDKVLYIQKSSGEDSETLLIVTLGNDKDFTPPECEVFTERDLIKEVIDSLKDKPMATVTENDMQKLLEGCTKTTRRVSTTRSRDRNTTSDSATYRTLPLIFPGTKWCGAGDVAKNYDDLGLHQDTDRCCRAHDLCDDILAPGETRNGLTNKTPFTALSCKCDDDFYNCLDRINSVTSNTVGNMYFNILKTSCYKEDHPTTKKCLKYRTFLKLKCLEYEKDTKAPKEYQWIPAKKYKKIPIPGPLTITLPF